MFNLSRVNILLKQSRKHITLSNNNYNNILKSTISQHSYTTQSALPSTPITPDLFNDEPQQPRVHTSAIPGQKSQELLNNINKLQDTRSIHFIANYDKAIGNYIYDADDNIYLDVFNSISSLSIGYNNQYLIDYLSNNKQFITSFINRPALGRSNILQ